MTTTYKVVLHADAHDGVGPRGRTVERCSLSDVEREVFRWRHDHGQWAQIVSITPEAEAEAEPKSDGPRRYRVHLRGTVVATLAVDVDAANSVSAKAWAEGRITSGVYDDIVGWDLAWIHKPAVGGVE